MFDKRQDALDMEASIVDEEFISRKDTYNLATGGLAGGDQWGPNNHQYGKPAHNRTPVCAIHKDGRVICAASITELGTLIGIARQNTRKLLQSGQRGRRGWLVKLAEDIV